MEETSLRFSEKRGDLFKALLLAKQEFPEVARDTVNPFVRKKYATLDGIQESIDPVLAKHGLVYSQHPLQGNRLVTILYHTESDQWMESEYGMTPVKDGPQEIGALITYMKRYALVAILGVRVLDEDDDGNSAQGRKTDFNDNKEDSKKEEAAYARKRDMAIKEINKCTSAEAVKKTFGGFEDDIRRDADVLEAATKRGKYLADKMKKESENNG